MSTFRPLLAEKINLEKLEYPVLASPKYDGFRCLIDGRGQPVSRNMKPIPNAYVFGKISEMKLPKLDGELLTYTGNKIDDFNVVQSKLSSRTGMPDFIFMVFDNYEKPTLPFVDRNSMVIDYMLETGNKLSRIKHVEQVLIRNEEELLDFEAKCLSENWEGVMTRSLHGPYKFGRSTVNEGILLKMKRFFDDEAIVVKAHELMHNANEATTNALGYTERSSHKDGFVGQDMLGKFTVRWKDVEFDIGTGFSEVQRRLFWNDPDKMIGLKLTFKYQSLGPNGKPRFPVFLGFRHD